MPYLEEALKLDFMRCNGCQGKGPNDLCASCFHNRTLIDNLKKLDNNWFVEMVKRFPLLGARDEDKRIILCALAGFELEKDERRFIKPLYLRLLEAEGTKLSDEGKRVAHGGANG